FRNMQNCPVHGVKPPFFRVRGCPECTPPTDNPGIPLIVYFCRSTLQVCSAQRLCNNVRIHKCTAFHQKNSLLSDVGRIGEPDTYCGGCPPPHSHMRCTPPSTTGRPRGGWSD